MPTSLRVQRAATGLAALLIPAGLYLGLSWSPPDAMMGDVYRILYIHVPSAWMALICFTVCFGASVTYLLAGKGGADALAHAAAEVGVVFASILLLTGSIWGRPTWGVWWTWDPRLTTAAIMWLAFLGYLALRRFVDDVERRSLWAAVAAVIIYVDIPIVWFSVKWWNSLHQMQSSPSTVDGPMVLALRVNSFALLAVMVALVASRYRLALKERETSTPAMPPLRPSAGTAS